MTPQKWNSSLKLSFYHQNAEMSSDLLLALLLQVEFDLQWLPRLQKGLSMFTVSHVVRHDSHSDGTHVDHYVGQQLERKMQQLRLNIELTHAQ